MSSLTVTPSEAQKHVEETPELHIWEEDYVDWRKRPAVKGRHGGMLAASFVLAVEVLENLAFLANASNLVLYLSKFMHYSPSGSANIVTNFMGTAFLLALLGGFLADAFFTTYSIFLLSAAIESLGLLILTLQAHVPYLKPPTCVSNQLGSPCHKVGGGKAVMLFAGLYLVALGVGGIKGSLPPHGAEQFDETTFEGRNKRSAFFNYFIFCLSCGALIAVTLVVWMEDNKGWQWGFGISTLTIVASIPIFLLGSPTYRIKTPAGSPITTIFKVLASAAFNNRKAKSSNNVVISISTSSVSSDSVRDVDEQTPITPIPTQNLEFLNRAAMNNPDHPELKCTLKQVEEAKVVLKIFPIFASTVMLNCCLAQLSTFSVQQAATMNTKLGSLKVPPASLPVFPVVFIMILAPTYNHAIVPIARKLTKSEMGITHLQRIGTGLVLSIVAMAVAALVETKRKNVALKTHMLDSSEPLPISFLWVALQYLFLGSADLFSLAGMMEFFFTEAPMSMRSLATALSWASLAMGYYFSSVLVSVINGVTKACRLTPWLYGRSLNHYHLERFYWLMCILSGLNFLQYLFWANRYTYRSKSAGEQPPFKEQQHKSDLVV
ncbi:protein NRT1/ PTR FAMILY 4.6-like isoform X1 [Cucurbita pepo subsp. pepo]|uniref:protein NRT1/ PTR FAMILY 4.6-like isoform X1 n=2 Tax=Cucurbita pepo subsp. pepo TaxID=3664 RepID=UPI000C9D2A74|nr:protein NRT1/ PTR FAMILY 4.6-like isoform X1 [Cucurbita pepo subsp. pepo]